MVDLHGSDHLSNDLRHQDDEAEHHELRRVCSKNMSPVDHASEGGVSESDCNAERSMLYVIRLLAGHPTYPISEDFRTRYSFFGSSPAWLKSDSLPDRRMVSPAARPAPADAGCDWGAIVVGGWIVGFGGLRVEKVRLDCDDGEGARCTNSEQSRVWFRGDVRFSMVSTLFVGSKKVDKTKN